MNEVEKQLLLTDLCSRLPYGVKGRVFTETSNGDLDINGDMIFTNEQFVVVLDQVNVQTEEIRLTAVGDEKTVEFIDNVQNFGESYYIEDFEPYLRPMSSMTEEEKEYVKNRWCYEDWDDIYDFLNHYQIDAGDALDFVDWLNAHHFDYRGLIEMGLALEAPKGMYEIK